MTTGGGLDVAGRAVSAKAITGARGGTLTATGGTAVAGCTGPSAVEGLPSASERPTAIPPTMAAARPSPAKTARTLPRSPALRGEGPPGKTTAVGVRIEAERAFVVEGGKGIAPVIDAGTGAGRPLDDELACSTVILAAILAKSLSSRRMSSRVDMTPHFSSPNRMLREVWKCARHTSVSGAFWSYPVRVRGPPRPGVLEPCAKAPTRCHRRIAPARSARCVRRANVSRNPWDVNLTMRPPPVSHDGRARPCRRIKKSRSIRCRR